MAKTLGILGGLGPAASVYFYRTITEHTKADHDQDHLDIVLVSAASIPDRTEFILGQSEKSPLPAMIDGVKRLVSAGAELIAIPCNTAHYFYDQIEKISPVPVLNIVRETVSLAKKAGVKKLGILATTGTVITGAYQNACLESGIAFTIPSEKSQEDLMNIIYGSIKTAKKPDFRRFLAICDELYANGADTLVLGCTELSLIGNEDALSSYRFIDSLLVLAARSIQSCGKIPTGFADIYSLI